MGPNLSTKAGGTAGHSMLPPRLLHPDPQVHYAHPCQPQPLPAQPGSRLEPQLSVVLSGKPGCSVL